MSETNKNRIKQSFILGSLTSSAGVFLSKIIGLFYVVPFTALATEKNMVFYSGPYSYYSILLQICSAGLPFATAAVVAKYANADNWKTVLLTRKLSLGVLAASGFLMGVLFIATSGPLALRTLGANATPSDIQKMRIAFMILALALFLVPVLSSYRGFYQGLKDLKVYADTQVFEQFGRVFFLLFLGWLFVKVFHFDSIYAVYMAVLATSLGAGIAILYYIHYDRRHIGPILREARNQEAEVVDSKQILKELFVFGLPYLLSAVIGNSQILINTRFFIPVTTSLGMNYDNAKLLYGIIQVQVDKLTSIPQVLGIGFSAGIVPYMTVALENENFSMLRKNIQECLETVLFIALPICFAMFALARPIYYIMYGNAHLNYGEICLQYASLLALVTTITPICSSMMMTLHLRKESLFYLFVGFVIKCATFYPLIRYIGYPGAIVSSVLCSLTIIYLDLAKLKNKFDVSYATTGKRLVKIVLACLAMNGGFALLNFVVKVNETNRMLALAQLALYGVVGIVLYFYIANMLKLPKAIFHKSMKEIFNQYNPFKRHDKN
ncbi:MAG: polysaccharide biosynthesis C-terminal domain-containing protein [Solobacterium sp.]|nr:polysaccharide biosynthesis C-terminal domain-containing protein [Solobacterium sp.]